MEGRTVTICCRLPIELPTATLGIDSPGEL